MTKEELALFEKILKATGDIAKAQSAVAERLQKIEDNAEARNALAGGGTGFTAPEERGAAPPPPTPATLPAKRDPADEEREGKIDPCAFMRMVVFSKMYGMADAAMMNCDKGSQGYKDAEYTLALTRLATMTRDAAIGTGGAGGFIAPEEWQVRMIELRAPVVETLWTVGDALVVVEHAPLGARIFFRRGARVAIALEPLFRPAPVEPASGIERLATGATPGNKQEKNRDQVPAGHGQSSGLVWSRRHF